MTDCNLTYCFGSKVGRGWRILRSSWIAQGLDQQGSSSNDNKALLNYSKFTFFIEIRQEGGCEPSWTMISLEDLKKNHHMTTVH